MSYKEGIEVNNIMDAHYKCQDCGNEWKQKPEPVTCGCGSFWINWTNWERWVAKRGKK